jgi:hypothetical protein
VAVVNVTFPGNLAQVESVTALRALPSTYLMDDAAYLVGEAGLFSFDPGSLENDDDVLIVRPNDRSPLEVGRWVLSGADAFDDYAKSAALALPLGAQGIGFIAAGTDAVARTALDKARERVTITDYGALDGQGIATAVGNALIALGTAQPARLIFPRGSYTLSAAADWSAYRNVTFVFEAGARINQSTNTVVLPERVEVGMGAGFTGTGAVTQKNKDQVPLVEPGAGHTLAGNVARGPGALGSITGGYSNMAEGVNALAKAQHVRSSIAFGNGALQSVVGDPTGARAYGTYYAFGDSNIAIGDIALRDTTIGYENLAIGVGTLVQNTTGRWNVAIGHESQITGAAGENNVSVGCYNLTTTQTGWAAMEVNSTGSGTAVGYVAMNAQTTGANNSALGQLALQLNTTGSNNTAIGQEALKNMVGGAGNTAVGAFAFGQSTGAAINNTAIGFNAALMATTAIECTAIGAAALSSNATFGNCSGLGTNAQVTGVNQVQLGDARTTTYAYGSIQNRSDLRDKADVRDTLLGLDFINALRPVDFRWDMREFYRDGNEPISEASPDGTKKRARYHHGLIAQEVRALITDGTIADFGGFQDHSMMGGDDVLSLGYEELIGPLIKAVQQLSAKVAVLEAAQ